MPAGQTPLCEHIETVVNNIKSVEDALRANNQKAIVVIATDGEASDGDVATALKPLERLPVQLVLRLCTDDEPILEYWNKVDEDLEIDLDVLDDLQSEAKEIQEANPWLTYPEYLHKWREFGTPSKELDLLDESALSSEQMRVVVCNLLFEGRKQSVPNPDEDWTGFIGEVKNRMKIEGTSNKVLDMVSKRRCDVIKLEKLKQMYSQNSFDGSKACTMS